jgi:hypothetical protein
MTLLLTLIDRLKTFFSFSSSSLRFMKSFLSGRSQKVFINGLFSNSVANSSGIFQGSILGPILFCLFINDIVLSLGDANFHLYADDLQIYLSEERHKMSACVDKINQILNTINFSLVQRQWY